MAKPSDEPARRKPRRGEVVATWIMTAMLVLGLAGFGITNFAGRSSTIGSVGDIKITTNEYAREVRAEVAGFGRQLGMQMSVQDALSLGIDRQALSQLVTRAALDDTARRIGISAGDASVRAELVRQPAFVGADGKFDATTYKQALQQNGWTDIEYEEMLRRELARSLLQGAVAGGITAPAAPVDALYRWIAERRGFSLRRITEADLPTPLAAPDDDALKAWYDGHIDAFTRPEAKRIRYAALLPEMIAADQPVDEADLKKLYDERRGEYIVPERRLVERLVFPDQAALDAAQARLAAGTPFETLVLERGLTLQAVDLGDVSRDDLGPAGDAVFAAAEGSIVAAESTLGPALFRVNGTLAGHETTLDEARAGLAAELQAETARRAVGDRVEEVDDLLAGGAGLDELAAQMGMKTGTIDHVAGQQGDDPLEGYKAFRDAADKLAEGDFPEAVILDDGGVVALEFVETVPAAPIPFDEARDRVAEAWREDALHKALLAQADALAAVVAANGGGLGVLDSVETTAEIAREGSVEGMPAPLVPTVFAMKAEGDVQVFEAGDFVALVRLDAIHPAADSGADADALRQSLAAQLADALSQDAFAAFAGAIVNQADIQIDQGAVSAINAQLQ